VRRTAGHSSLDHRISEDILEELKIHPIEMKLVKYKETQVMLAGWKTLDNYRPIGRRRPGRPLKETTGWIQS